MTNCAFVTHAEDSVYFCFRFSGCDLIDQCCESVASGLQSADCPLRELDLSNNDLRDSGMKLLCDGLKNPNCQLEILRCLVKGTVHPKMNILSSFTHPYIV